MMQEIKHKVRQIAGRIRNPDTKYRSTATSIDDFRKDEFRVFRALRYFATDLQKEVMWHQENLEKLKNFKENPETFYNQFMSTTTDKNAESLQQHYHKHVIEGYDIHNKFMENHARRLDTLKEMIPMSTYSKLVKVSAKYGGIPDYFVYDKKRHEVFFVVDNPNHNTKTWSDVVRRNNLGEVLFLRKI
jgi:hypothetical protein